MINSLAKGIVWASVLVLSLMPAGAIAGSFQVVRLNNAEPIITRQHFEKLQAQAFEGSNINGPSVIRIPEWIPAHKRASEEAEYYMYFAHHQGRYIRLAWAATIEGPWNLFQTGPAFADGERGVLDIGDDRSLALGNSLTITKHIASPDVHVDSVHKRIIMYFHGNAVHEGKKLSRQRSFVATSPWGLDFSSGIEPVTISTSYLRAFEYNGALHGLSSSRYYTARDNVTPWAAPEDYKYGEEDLWQKHEAQFMDFSNVKDRSGRDFAPKKTRVRHSSLYRKGSTLYIFFTMKRHSPERVLATRVDLQADCWYCYPPQAVPEEILRAERPWEGSEIIPSPSRKGPEYKLTNAIRDPFVFEDRGRLYLFYVGGGERAIGVARLTLAAADSNDPDTVENQDL